MDKALVVMAKEPVPGLVKTRLIPYLGKENSAKLYQLFILNKIETVRKIKNADIFIAYFPLPAKKYFSDIAPKRFKIIPQVGNTLSSRMFNVFKNLIKKKYKQIVMIGTDSPLMPNSYIKKAFNILYKNPKNLVLGPCDDGGYYLIGLCQLNKKIFNMTMSTPNVYKNTKSIAKKCGYNVFSLPQHYDVDTINDLKRFANEL